MFITIINKLKFSFFIFLILSIIIVGLSIVMPIYYSYKKKKLAQQLKEGREVTEREKIRVYVDNINEKFRAKRK